MKGWLLEGLREVARIARERPDLVERVRLHPSGFFSVKEPEIPTKPVTPARRSHGSSQAKKTP